MSQTNINIRMDEKLKKQFDKFCSDVGMTMTTAFCMFAKTVVREQRIPFEIRTDNPNEVTAKAIENTIQGKNLSRNFTSVSDLSEELNAEDKV